jgi:hypothetical protein
MNKYLKRRLEGVPLGDFITIFLDLTAFYNSLKLLAFYAFFS